MPRKLVNIDKRSRTKGGSRRSACETICTAWSLPIPWETLYSILREGRSGWRYFEGELFYSLSGRDDVPLRKAAQLSRTLVAC